MINKEFVAKDCMESEISDVGVVESNNQIKNLFFPWHSLQYGYFRSVVHPLSAPRTLQSVRYNLPKYFFL